MIGAREIYFSICRSTQDKPHFPVMSFDEFRANWKFDVYRYTGKASFATLLTNLFYLMGTSVSAMG